MVGHKPRLQRYLKSFGQRLPTNYKDYIYTADCLFCASLEAVFPVLIFPRYRQTKGYVNTGANACMECADEIIVMETEMLEGKDPRSDIFLDRHLNTQERIEEYVYNGRFDDTVTLHYNHYTHDEAPAKYNCYFCKGHMSGDEGRLLLKTPVGSKAKVLSGGKIAYCMHCHHALQMEKNSQDIEPEKMYAKAHCFECEEEYMITVEEQEMRNYSAYGQDAHLCPECTYKSLHGMSAHVLYKDYQWPDRDLYNVCQFCDDSVVVDLSLPRSFIRQNYIADNTRPVCLHCRVSDQGDDIPVAGKRLSRTYILLVFENAPKRYMFYILRVLETGRRKVIYSTEETGMLIDLLTEFLTGAAAPYNSETQDGSIL